MAKKTSKKTSSKPAKKSPRTTASSSEPVSAKKPSSRSKTTTGTTASSRKSPKSKVGQQIEMRPAHHEIALRAYEIWCAEGCPAGHEIQNWLRAEADLTEATAR